MLSLVGSLRTIRCRIGRSGGSSSDISLTKTSGKSAGKSGFSCGLVIADLKSGDKKLGPLAILHQKQSFSEIHISTLPKQEISRNCKNNESNYLFL